jgi:hypothetical protein
MVLGTSFFVGIGRAGEILLFGDILQAQFTFSTEIVFSSFSSRCFCGLGCATCGRAE